MRNGKGKSLALMVAIVVLVNVIFVQTARSEYGDIVMNHYEEIMEKVGLQPVVFPHWFHRIRFKCNVCHESIFSMQKGMNKVTMGSMIKGDFCGRCHNDKIAWDLIYCDRCHSFKPRIKKEVRLDLDKDDIKQRIYLDNSGILAGTGDPARFVGAMYKLGLDWHPKALDFPKAPKDKYGLIDWVKLLKNRFIEPKASLDSKNKEDTSFFDLDIVMPIKTGLMSGVLFPHRSHSLWLSCENCHPQPFLPVVGLNNITMAEIVRGKSCGVCHGKVSFALNDCERCHQDKTK